MYRHFLLALPVLALLLVGCPSMRAHRAMLDGDYDQAALRYAAELRTNPGNARAAVFYGYSLYKGGHCRAAYDALMPLAENIHVGSYASFWAGLAALRLKDAEKLRAAWILWRMARPGDFETTRLMDHTGARLSKKTLTDYDCDALADEMEHRMNVANAKDAYVREQNRGEIFGDAYPYSLLLPPHPLPYLP